MSERILVVDDEKPFLKAWCTTWNDRDISWIPPLMVTPLSNLLERIIPI